MARSRLEAGPWRKIAFSLSDRVPTMISREETKYLWWLTSTVWRDVGHVVEMGPWLGGSTACLAEGMRARRRAPAHRLYTVDNFVWRAFMSDRAEIGLTPGESFEAAFCAHVAPYRDLIVVERAWLPDEQVPGDAWASEVRGEGAVGELFRWNRQPVELAFVDGAKSWRGFAHLLGELGPSLGDHSLLVLQDYKYWGSYWVPMMTELLADQLELVHVLPHNTVSFRVTGRLPTASIGSIPGPADGVRLLACAAERLSARGDRVGAEIVRLSAVRFLAHGGDLEAAVDMLRRRTRSWPVSCSAGELALARSWLESFAGCAVSSPRLHPRVLARSTRRRLGSARRRSATVYRRHIYPFGQLPRKRSSIVP